ncbi:helix-turn-helix domain-containing protein [Chelatococcus sp. YT9]|uniref:helix-turn-helix domain-containing protein n=1 Tax=Chelatococcus sp. YT9 TaxID=2835635 RepID=UPI001BCDD29D|nr:helix-turn-helix domain-containing protein [Chelatococcus sp. YT9]MBS7698591.1 hypothetical protein [Chelatococcus sp. YT9]
MTTQLLNPDSLVTIPVYQPDKRIVSVHVLRSEAEALGRIRVFAASRPLEENCPKPIILPPHEGAITRRRCIQIAAWASQIDRETILSPVRKGGAAKARQIAYWLIRRFCGSTLNEIGQAFGGKDHTAVLHGVRRVNAVIAHMDLDGLSPEDIARALWTADWSTAR